jgi:hypothetical protein
MRRIADHPYWTTAGPGQTVTGFVREGGLYPIASLGTYAANTATTATTWTWPSTYANGTACTNSWYAYSNVGVVAEPKVAAEVRISAELFRDHPDPDAVLGDQMNVLRKQLEEALGMTIAREAVWEEWCSPRESWGDEIVLRAEWTPRALTIEAWDAWQNLPKLRRVWDAATRRFEEIDEAEFARRAWKSNRHSLIMRNRGRASELRAKLAERRAEALLREHLDETQWRDWDERKRFHVQTADGERVYEIRRGRAGNIYLVKGVNPRDPRVKRFCFHEYHPSGRVPVADNVLAQALFIQYDEERFLELANPS